MSKLACRCGYVIVDQSGALPYKAALFADGDGDRLWEGLAQRMAEFAAACAAGERAAWLRRHFGSGYPTELDDEQVIHDLVVSVVVPFRRVAYECQACGALWVQRAPDDLRFQGYAAPRRGAPGILAPAARGE